MPPLALAHSVEVTEPMLLVAEAFARGKGGKTRTDGFKSRVVPVPKAMVRATFSEKAVSVADGIIQDIAVVVDLLAFGIRLAACGGDKEKLSQTMKSQKARNRLDRYTQPARECLRRRADVMFFPEMWARMGAKVDADFAPIRLAFLEALAGAARAEFRAALPGIPCASLMRPRAEVRSKQALEWGLYKAMRDLKPTEVVDA